MTDERPLTIELTGVDCPVLPGVTVGPQRGNQVVDEQPADGSELCWRLEARLLPGPDLRGPYVHGRPGGRFVYLSWSRGGDGMFRRAKLMLDAVPGDLLTGEVPGLRAHLGLAMPDGSPVCSAVRPPQIRWSLL